MSQQDLFVLYRWLCLQNSCFLGGHRHIPPATFTRGSNEIKLQAVGLSMT